MSERLMLVRQLESKVRARLPTECQKYKTRCGAPPRKREPNTTSACPDQGFDHPRILRRIVLQIAS